MTDNQIIPIERDSQEQAITAMILSKRAQNLAQLARRPGMVDDLLRGYYEQAQQQGVLIMINTAIKTLGQQAPPGVWEWHSVNGTSLKARYNASTGITTVIVGELTVLTNENPHACQLVPGEWLHHLRDCYAQRERELAWQIEIEKTRQDTQKVADFLTDV